MLTFTKVSKKYGQNFVLSDLDLEIKDGEFVFVIGPSGAGKTTFLKLILREILPTSGKIIFDDFDYEKFKNKNLPKLRRNIGMVFQDFKLLTDRTVFENIAVALDLRGENQKKIFEKVKEVTDLTSISSCINLFPVELSGGELQKVSLARAIIAEPKILLADEPTGNLDPKSAREILELLEKINKMGTTVIVATHNAGLVNKFKKRVISIKEGKIVKDEVGGKYEETV